MAGSLVATQLQDAALVELGLLLQEKGYAHTAVTPATHALVNSRPGNEWAVDLAGIFGWSRAFRSPLISPDVTTLMREAGILAACPGGWRSTLRVSSLQENVLFHSAYPTLQPDAVFFGPDTYRFVRAINQHLAASSTPVSRAVDIGCGAGPGAIAIANARPKAEVFAVDINEHALRLTEVNVALAEISTVSAIPSNLLTATEGQFDLIVANPPYLVDPAARTYRDGGGALGAQLSLGIVRSAASRLSADGTLLLYTGSAIVNGVDVFRMQAEELLRASGLQWDYQEVDPDVFGEELSSPAYANTDRIAAVVLTARRR